MGNSRREMMPISTSYTPDAAQLPASLTGIASPMPTRAPEAATMAPAEAHRWHIECLGWWPNGAPDNRRVGTARLLLPGGMVVQASVVRTDAGLRCAFPRRRVKCSNQPERTERGITFPDPADWHAFSVAALAAVERFQPGSLPIDHPTTETRHTPILAAANTRNHQ